MVLGVQLDPDRRAHDGFLAHVPAVRRRGLQSGGWRSRRPVGRCDGGWDAWVSRGRRTLAMCPARTCVLAYPFVRIASKCVMPNVTMQTCLTPRSRGSGTSSSADSTDTIETDSYACRPGRPRPLRRIPMHPHFAARAAGLALLIGLSACGGGGGEGAAAAGAGIGRQPARRQGPDVVGRREVQLRRRHRPHLQPGVRPVANTVTERTVTETGHNMFCPGTTNLADGRLLINGGISAAHQPLRPGHRHLEHRRDDEHRARLPRQHDRCRTARC
jgi:hypothetical protein